MILRTCDSARSAARMTSTARTTSGQSGRATLVTIDKASVRSPQADAATASGTVDMPTTSPPIRRKKTVLGTRLVVGACHGNVYPAMGRKVFAAGDVERLFDQDRVVHRCVSWPVPRQGGRRQSHLRRLQKQQVDVVRDHDDVSGSKLGIQPAAGVGQDQTLCAQRSHGQDRQRQFGRRVTFVSVTAAVHDDYGPFAVPAAHQAAAVPHGGRTRKVRNVGIGNHRFGLHQAG